MASYDASVTILWGDGMHVFRLGIGELEEIQEKTGAGVYKIFERLLEGGWMVGDLREIIRVGLIGGGMKPLDVLKLMERYFVVPILDHVPVATAILGKAIFRPKGRASKKKTAVTESDPTASTSSSSTQPVPA